MKGFINLCLYLCHTSGLVFFWLPTVESCSVSPLWGSCTEQLYQAKDLPTYPSNKELELEKAQKYGDHMQCLPWYPPSFPSIPAHTPEQTCWYKASHINNTYTWASDEESPCVLQPPSKVRPVLELILEIPKFTVLFPMLPECNDKNVQKYQKCNDRKHIVCTYA